MALPKKKRSYAYPPLLDGYSKAYILRKLKENKHRPISKTLAALVLGKQQ